MERLFFSPSCFWFLTNIVCVLLYPHLAHLSDGGTGGLEKNKNKEIVVRETPPLGAIPKKKT